MSIFWHGAQICEPCIIIIIIIAIIIIVITDLFIVDNLR